MPSVEFPTNSYRVNSASGLSWRDECSVSLSSCGEDHEIVGFHPNSTAPLRTHMPVGDRNICTTGADEIIIVFKKGAATVSRDGDRITIDLVDRAPRPADAGATHCVEA